LHERGTPTARTQQSSNLGAIRKPLFALGTNKVPTVNRTPWSEYPVAYWVCIAGAFALLIIDIFDDMAWTNFGTVVLIGIAVLLRPGGIRGPR
jgi:hypothetical protein